MRIWLGSVACEREPGDSATKPQCGPRMRGEGRLTGENTITQITHWPLSKCAAKPVADWNSTPAWVVLANPVCLSVSETYPYLPSVCWRFPKHSFINACPYVSIKGVCEHVYVEVQRPTVGVYLRRFPPYIFIYLSCKQHSACLYVCRPDEGTRSR